MSGDEASGAVAEGEVTPLFDNDELHALIATGQERGYLRLEEVAAALSEVEVTREHVGALYAHLTEQGIERFTADWQSRPEFGDWLHALVERPHAAAR